MSEMKQMYCDLSMKMLVPQHYYGRGGHLLLYVDAFFTFVYTAFSIWNLSRS